MGFSQMSWGPVLVMLAGSAVSAEPPARETMTVRHAVGLGEALPHNLAGGEPGAASVYDLVFDNMTDADSYTGYNVAYVHSDGYSRSAYFAGMCSVPGGVFDAPAHPDSGIPTDIWFDEYAADPVAWGAAPGTLQTLTMLDNIPVICPALRSNPTVHDWVLMCGVLNWEGDMWHGGFEIVWADVPADYCDWFGNEGVDLLGNGLQFDISDVGWLLYDWRQDLMDSDEGCGMIIAGGDLIDGDFPTPDEQWTLGETDFTYWIASDGVTGVDPGWDGDPGDTSYLDVLNGSSNINWAFVDPLSNPTSELAHDFPFRLYIHGEGPGCVADLDGDFDSDQTDLGILLASWHIDDGGDINGDGVTDQQDLGILLADYGCGT